MLYRFKSILCLIMPLVLLVSCGLKINDTVEKAKPVSVQKNCFSKIDKVTEDYYSGQLSEAEIKSFNECALNTVEVFRNYVAGEDKKVSIASRIHKKAELKNFFQRVIFTEDKVVTDALVDSLMSLKVSFVGGDKESLSNEELIEVKSWIEFISIAFQKLNPHMSLISKKAMKLKGYNKDLSEGFNQLEKDLNVIGYEFYSKLPNSGQPIEIVEIETLVLELMKFYGWDNDTDKKSRLDNAKKSVELIKVLKEAMLNESGGNKITKSQWSPFIKNIAKGYKAYLSGQIVISEFKKGKLNTKLINQVIESFILIINDSLKNYSNKTIPWDKIDPLLEAAHQFNAVSEKLSLNSLKALAKVMVNKLFNPYYNTEAHPSDSYDGFTQSHIGFITNFKNSWKNSVELIQKENFMETGLSTIKDYIKPLFSDYSFSAKVNYSAFNEIDLSNKNNLIINNSMDHLVRLIIKAYAKNKDYAFNDVGLTAEEIQRFTDDINSVLLDLKLINPGIIDAGNRMYFEGNLFTPTGNGFPLKDFDESKSKFEGLLEKFVEFSHGKEGETSSKRIKKIFYGPIDSGKVYKKQQRRILERDEMLNMGLYIFSSAKASEKMYEKLVDKSSGCFPEKINTKDLYCKKMVLKECFIDNLLPMIDTGLNGLSELNKVVKADDEVVTASDELSFKEIIMKTILQPDENTEKLGYMHIVKLAQISHYIETSFLRFDLDQNGIIDKKEVLAAYPHFEGLIDKMVSSRKAKKPEDDISEEDSVTKEVKGLKKAWSGVKGKLGDIKNSVGNKISHTKRINIFLHMMKYGDIPSPKDVVYASTIQSLKGWDFNINRRNAFAIFGGVINSVNAENESRKKNFSYTADYYNVICD